MDELLDALNVTGPRRMRPPAGLARTAAAVAAGGRAAGVAAGRLVLPCRTRRCTRSSGRRRAAGPRARCLTHV